MKTNHSMTELFDQLGLESGSESIEAFIKQHQLRREVAIERAPFWKPHQVDLIVASRADDADWSDTVDDLDTLLHKESMR